MIENSLDILEQLEDKIANLDEYKELSELNRNILHTHFDNPKLTQLEIANLLKCSRITVNRFFNSPEFEVLTREIGKVRKNELVPLAIDAFRECLTSKSEQIKLSASIRILEDLDILKREVSKIDNSKKIINLEWKKDANSIHPPELSRIGTQLPGQI